MDPPTLRLEDVALGCPIARPRALREREVARTGRSESGVHERISGAGHPFRRNYFVGRLSATKAATESPKEGTW